MGEPKSKDNNPLYTEEFNWETEPKTFTAEELAASLPRLCYAAAHVVMKDEYRSVPHSIDAPGSPEEIAEYIDWDTTMKRRVLLAEYGFGIAEAMDTAQRFSIGWPNAKRLIEECGRLNLDTGFVAGAGTDQLSSIESKTQAVDAVVEQARFIQYSGGDAILLPIPWLAEQQASVVDYVDVYNEIVQQLDGPVFLHWLGEAFMPALKGYFPGESFFDIMAAHPEKIRGAKLSLLDADFERAARERLLENDQIVLTGDDFHFGEMMLGDGQEVLRQTTIGDRTVPLGRFSHGLLGIFDAIAAPASSALRHLARGDTGTYEHYMGRCETLSRTIFQAPTQFYKSGLAFIAYLRGEQSNPILINHEERNRDMTYYEDVYVEAKSAGVLYGDPAKIHARLQSLEDYLSN